LNEPLKVLLLLGETTLWVGLFELVSVISQPASKDHPFSPFSKSSYHKIKSSLLPFVSREKECGA
jgi:hypothetical protein